MNMKPETIFQIPAEVTEVRSKRLRSALIKLETQENLTDDALGRISGFVGKTGWFTFSVPKIDPGSIQGLNTTMPEKDEKSPSQRLRNVLFVLFQQEGGKGEFETYYKQKIEKFIEFIREKLT